MFEDTSHTHTRVEVRATQPEPLVEAPGWIPRYVAHLGDCERALQGARLVMDRMDREFAARKHCASIYAVPYLEARKWVQSQLDAATPPPDDTTAFLVTASAPRPIALRVLAGVAALVLFMAYVWVNLGASLAWMMYVAITHKERSPLRAMAEGAILFSMLDWRRLIQRLALITIAAK